MMLRYSPFQNQKNAFTPVPIGVFFMPSVVFIVIETSINYDLWKVVTG